MKILFENKQLNEGPGAGYTVSGTLTNVKVDNIKNIEVVSKDGDIVEYEVELDATATFEDVSANSYYYGGTIDSTPVSIIRARVELDEGEVTVADVKWAIENAKIEANLGGGWSHSTFDGFIEVDYNGIENASYLMGVLFELTNKDDVEYLDRAVQDDIEAEDEQDLEESAEKWVHFLYKSGANPYIAKSTKEAEELMKKYGNKVEKISDTGYVVDDRESDLFSVSESTQKPLTESFSDEDRINALAAYLGIEPSEISNTYDYEFETPEGDYFVVDENEARELAEEDIRNLFDDLGMESFTPDFRDWIMMNALDVDWFEDAVREAMENYVEDIEDESSSMGYDNRLIEELHDHQVLSDEDFEEDEDGEPDFRSLKDSVDIDSAREEYIDLLVEDAGHPVDYCADNFGWDWVSEVADQNGLIDMEEVVDECIFQDGIAHFIARYDGDEIELGNGLYAYRTN